MEDTNRWGSIPAFGNWEFYEELPITQYFEVHAKPSQNHHKKVRQSAKGTGAVVHQNQNQNQKQRQKQKQSKVCDVLPQTQPKRVKHPKAVDEDLYKIPPELLQQKPKRKRMLVSFLLGCIRMNCISA
ncbi:hypothetical protein IHE45_05G154500 [Dioscorea alata]|uniref:Uncharacterized protein n=2 Tax=Dioscorea alata TaxID=55571 RepID=A0ACB7W6C3_DIOAL|nr:hypothetical protein IHE45_05G154500 [Dioscorea alata]KAH7682984.1 hypothetical protein IHE45_05G154500 [Dioscorea alata]